MKPEPEAAPSVGPLIILGASVRALAESARRAGWAVHAADLFRDLDLVAAAREAVRMSAAGGGYPRDLADVAARFPSAAPWCYTGALENHPDLIASLAAARPLAGNPAEVVERIRDPALLARAVAAAALTFPETHRHPDGLPTDGSYLVKPLASAGGHGIRRWTAETAASWSTRRAAPDRSTHVWQRFSGGVPVSAGYVVAAGVARLIGVSRQLVGAEWCHAPRFAWCGGVTEACPRLAEEFARLGTVLAATFHPVGVIGVDAMIEEDGCISVLEVNPRPTASMELFERSTGISIAVSHLSACGRGTPPSLPPKSSPREPRWHWAKAVLFTPSDVAVSPRLVESLRRIAAEWTTDDGGWATLADVPGPDQVLAAGAPVCTLFAHGQRPEGALELLRRRVTAVDGLLGASHPRAAARGNIRGT